MHNTHHIQTSILVFISIINKPNFPHGGPVHCCAVVQRLSVHVLLLTPTDSQAASQAPQALQVSSLQPK